MTGTGSDGKTVTATYTYSKKAPAEIVRVYFDNSKYNWQQVYAYIYDDTGAAVVQNAAWPGRLMTFSAAHGLFEIDVPDNLTNGRVIFTESKSATTNRYPADQKPGLAIENTSKVFSYGYSWQPFTIPEPEFSNNSYLAGTKIPLGDSVVVNCSSAGGKGTVTYAVYYKKTGDEKWSSQQSFSENTAVSIKPSYATTYDICIKAKDSTDTILKKYLTLTVTANANTNLSNTSTLSSTTVAVDKPITVKCSSTGGNGTTYAVFYRKSTDTSWTKKQDFTANTQVTIKPASATPYTVCVKAKDSAGNIAKLYLDFTATASATSKLTNTSTISATSAKVGDKITVKASGTGNSGTKTYAFYYKAKSDTKWTAKKSFSSTTSVSMTFSKAGTYEICTKVKDATGSIAKKYFTVKIS